MRGVRLQASHLLSDVVELHIANLTLVAQSADSRHLTVFASWQNQEYCEVWTSWAEGSHVCKFWKPMPHSHTSKNVETNRHDTGALYLYARAWLWLGHTRTPNPLANAVTLLRPRGPHPLDLKLSGISTCIPASRKWWTHEKWEPNLDKQRLHIFMYKWVECM